MTAPVATRVQALISLRQIVNQWYELEYSGYAVWIFLTGFVAIWTCFQVLSFASVDLHPDMVEVFAWSRHLSFGYYKHPPLNALIAAAWFSVLPVADWSFHLLAMVNSAIALLGVDLISRRYLSGDKRLLVLLLLVLTPFYQFHGQRFSTNQTLLSTWPIATYCFLRAFESRRSGWAVAAGVAAAAAMLGKYYSIYLIAGFCIAAIMHPERRLYFASSSPWISVAVGMCVLMPHVVWLWRSGWQPFHYAVSVHGADSWWMALTSIGSYVIGALGYVALPVCVYVIASRTDRQALRDAFWPSEPSRRMLVVLLAAPMLLPIVTALIARVQLTSLWTMQSWFLLPIVLLSPRRVSLQRSAAIDVGLAVLAVTMAALVAAPALAWSYHVRGTKEGREYYRLVSAELTREWRRETGHRLSIVAGDPDLAAAATFYSSDSPDYVPGFHFEVAPWVTPQRLDADGWVSICKNDDETCIADAERYADSAGRARKFEIELTPVFLQHAGRPGRFLATFFLPRAEISG